MKLYAIRPYGGGDAGRLATYLKENYVSLGYPGIGDLENAGREAIRERLANVYGYEGDELETRTNEAALFAGEIRDGDAVLVADGEHAYLGDVGDYYYVEEADVPADGTCHRRGVTWLRRLSRAELNELVLRLLDAPGAVTAFGLPWPLAQLDFALAPPGANAESVSTATVAVDRRTVEEALAILKEAMRSDDPDRRERAAAAILQYARPG